MWLKVKGEESVSATLLAVSFVSALIANALHVAGKIPNLSEFMNMFYVCFGIHFARDFNIGSLSFKSSKSDDKQQG